MTKLYLTMPQPGETITEGTIVKWLVKPGETVQEGTLIAEMETDKALFEHESPFAGKILKILESDQSRVAVAKPIAIIEVAKENAERYLMLGIATEVEGEVGTAQPALASVPKSKASSAKPNPSFVSSAALHDVSYIKMSPYVRRVAFQSNVALDTLQQLAASHEERRVTKEAIENYLQTNKNLPPVSIAVTVPSKDYVVQPYSPIRVRIAENMAMSKAKIPHAHTGISIDVTKLVEFRKKNKVAFQKKHGTNLNFLSLLFPALITALKKFPALNASFHEMPGKMPEIRLFNHINLGVAVGSESGLIIPVIKNAETLDFQNFNAVLNDKTQRAMNKQLKPEDFSGTTIIFNNFGFFGLNMGVQIIQYPLAATLGMGAIEKKVVPVGGEIVVRDIANFFLAFDHRIIDGLESGQFLSTLKSEIENSNVSRISLSF